HDDVLARSKGRCEAQISPSCTGKATQAHHVVTRRRGVGWPWLHDASRNGVACCVACHPDVIHVTDQRRAKALGLLASRPATDEDPGLILPRIAAARRRVDKS